MTGATTALAWSNSLADLHDRPFCAFDLDQDVRWVEAKLLHQLQVPTLAAWCFGVADYTDDLFPALRLCPWHALLEAADALEKHPIRFDAESFGNMERMRRANETLHLIAMWMLGNILNEINHRKKSSDRRYRREWSETHQHVMARLDAKVAAMRERCSTSAG